MNEEKEIMVKDLNKNARCFVLGFSEEWTTEDFVDELYRLGYRKTVWHKVADGDLPKKQGQKVWLCTISKDYFMANYWDSTVVGEKQFFEVASGGRITLSNVLAWAELPKYEE